MKVTISATWLRLPWQMQTWDQAYDYVIKAGGGDHGARVELAHVKIAAQANNPVATQVKANFDAVAKLVTAGLPKPSVFVPQQRRKSPLLPGGAGVPGSGAQPQGAGTRKLQETIKRQAQQLKQAQARMKQQQTAQMAKQAAQAQQRSAAAARVAARNAEQVKYETELDMLRTMLERRDLADEMRAKLEAQAEQYEALIDKLKAGGPSAEAATTSEAMAAEQVEAEQDDAADAYPSGVPGDVEFSNAGH